MLNWAIRGVPCDYRLNYPPLSVAEEEAVEHVSKAFIECSNKDSKLNVPDSLDQLLAQYCRKNNLHLDQAQSTYLNQYVYSNVIGFCGLDELLKNDAFEEIAIIGVNKPTYVYHNQSGWLKTNLFFRNEEGAINVINKIARPLGRRITYQNPKLNAILPDGSRLHASMPPISDAELTIRKFRRNPLTVSDLLNGLVYSAEQLAFLSMVFQLDYNVLIAGNTASGKSSTLNALFSFVPLSERVLIIEETPEINIPHKHKVKLLANSDISIEMRHLVEDSLRMRPDRMIVGEVRTKEEISALMDTILSGQARGSYATFHAQSSEEVVKRLVSQGVPLADISSLDFLIIQRRILRYDKTTRSGWEERRCVEISEISGQDSKINNIFTFAHSSSRQTGDLARSSKLGEMSEKLSMSASELFGEIAERKKFILELSKKELNFEDTVNEIQSFLFSSPKNIADLVEGHKCSKKTTKSSLKLLLHPDLI